MHTPDTAETKPEMTTVEKITPSMFPDVFDAFLRDDDPALGANDWKHLFNNQSNPEDHLGYVLVDGSRLVGMIGTFFSTRIKNGETTRFCNLHSWKVNPEHRGMSLALLRPVLRLQDYTLTDFTPSEQVYHLGRRLGLQKLNATLRILWPVPTHFGSSRSTPATIVDGPELEGLLSADHLAILRDHDATNVHHFAVRAGDDYCFIVYSCVHRHWMPYAHIHYLSNIDLFGNAYWAIRNRLISPHGCRFATVDDRLLEGEKLPASSRCPVQSRQLFRSCLPESAVDSLYSELVHLNLTSFPSIRHQFQRHLVS
jgi:hypothetical protein